MPQIIPFVVTAIVSVTSAVVAAGPLAVAAFNAANVLGAAALANEAFKAVQPSVKSSSTAIEWTADPNAPNRFAFGRVGGAGNIIHNATYGPDNMYVGFVGVMSASGPINRWVGFRAEETPVTFDGSGKANSSYYANVMWLDRLNGTQPETRALSSPSGLKSSASMPSWGSSAKLSGKAAYMYTLGENSKRSAYEGKVPTGIHTIEGLLCYDPRRDDTYPGGSGSCRLNDPSTWVYSTNAYIHGLNWAIGRWEGLTSGATGAPYASMKVGGIGARPEAIDFAAYVEGANVFDENAWACAAWPDADQGKAAVLDSFLQAGGGIYAERQGRISCMHRAAPRTSVATIRTEDTAGTIEYDTTTSLLDRINTIRPEYWSENHNWQMVATDEVTSSVWRLEDGQGVALTKSKGMQYNYVPGSKQARELACLQIAHTREGIRGTAPLRHYLDLEVGDCIDFEVPEAVLNGQKVIILNVDPDLENDIINVTFASESDPKYPFAFGQTAAPPPAPSIVPGDPTIVTGPLPGDWTVVVTPPAPGGGGYVPGFDLSGTVSNATATGVLVEWSSTATGPWTQAYLGPPTVETIPITGVQPGGIYYIGVSYLRGQNTSQRQVYGPYTAPDLTAEVSSESPIWGQLNDNARDILQNAVDDLHGLFDADEATGATAADLYDRLGLAFEIDPVERTALVREDVVFEGVGPGGLNETLVQTTTRLSAVDAVNAAATAQVLINAKAYTDAYKTEAALTFATQTGLGAAISGARGEWRSYADAAAAGAVVGLVTNAVLSSSLATARGQWESYATAAAATAVIGLDTVAAREGALALAKGQWESYATAAAASATIGLVTGAALAGSLATAKGQWEAHANAAAANAVLGLDTVVAREGAIAATVLALQSYTNSAVTTSAATLATQTSLNGVSAIASLALSTANGNEAYAALTVDVANRLTGMRINGVNRSIEFLAEYFKVTPNGTDGIYFDGTAGRFKVVKGGQKVVLAAASGVTLWAGPTSVADGSEAYNNGILGIGSAGAYFGGETLSRPFDSDEAGSGSALISLSSSFQDITPAISKQVINGRFLFWPQFAWQGSGAFDSDAGVYRLGIEYRILSTDPTAATGETLATGSVNRVSASSASFPAIGYAPTPSWGSSVPGSASGLRRLVIQARISFGASAGVSSRRLAGIYHS